MERVCETCGLLAVPVAIQVGSDGDSATIGDLLTPLTRPVVDRAWFSWACWPFTPAALRNAAT